MALLSFQKPAVAACLQHIYSHDRIQWNGLSIHAPAGIDASVSSGKSVMIAHLAKAVLDASHAKNRRARILVLQRQGELASQNSEAGWSIGLENSIYSGGLGQKSTYFDVIFGTEKTVYNALETDFTEWQPDFIMIDEGHQVPYDKPESQYVKILIHCYKQKPNLRVIKFSGSWFRDCESTIGPYWQKALTLDPVAEGYPEGGEGNGKITTEWMSANGWVVPVIFGWPSNEQENSYADEYAKLTTKSGSWEFDEAELDAATSDIKKLFRIMAEVIDRSKDRKGVLIFAATHRHLKQIRAVMKALGVPDDQIGAITDSTPEKARRKILERAKAGQCKYTLNVGVLTTGVNCPWWDTLVYLRPIGSLVLLVQSLGRVLRLLLPEDGPDMVEMDAMTVEERLALIAASDKPNALLMDFAGVMDRLGSMYDNPVLEQAALEHSKRKGDLITCPACGEMNSMFARRCIGISGGSRCEHFFQSKDCPDCGTKNDTTARECRNCARQLIDPNAVLNGKHYTDAELVPVLSMKLEAGKGGLLMRRYELADGRKPINFYYPNAGNTPASKKVNTKVWWNEVCVPHIPPGEFRNKSYRFTAETAVKSAALFNVPTHISARYNEKTKKWTIGRQKFRSGNEVETIEIEEAGEQE